MIFLFPLICLLFLHTFRDRSGDCSIYCHGGRAADPGSWAAHPHSQEKPWWLVGRRTTGLPNRISVLCCVLSGKLIMNSILFQLD